MLLGFNDSKCTAYTVDSARGLIVIRTHLVLASGKRVLQKKVKKNLLDDTTALRSKTLFVTQANFLVVLQITEARAAVVAQQLTTRLWKKLLRWWVRIPPGAVLFFFSSLYYQ